MSRLAAHVVVFAAALGMVAAHQSLSKIATTRQVACRIGFKQFCPGPCPRTDIRYDMNKDNPSMIVRRGQRVHIRTLANNHEGGFSRWTLVHVRDMMNHNKHRQNAFLWSCGDTGRKYCSRRYRTRDCFFDISNVHYNHYVRIPKIYPDGVYVLGWVWFGGGGTWGFFGDYYDCAFIEIRGGPGPVASHRPEFIPGNSHLSRNGKCRATVNDVGICKREPCEGGGRFTKLFKPRQFERGRPRPLYKYNFKRPYRRKRASVLVKTLTIRRNWNPRKIIHRARHSSELSRNPYLHIKRSMGITITAETSGKVRYVEWFVNGYKGSKDYKAPYSIAGDWEKGWKTTVTQYARWNFYVENAVTTVSAMAKGKDGSTSWLTMEISSF